MTLSWTQGAGAVAPSRRYPRRSGRFSAPWRHDPARRSALAGDARPDRRRDAGRNPTLWPLGISGDLPIVLFRISDTEDIAALHEVLAAHEYLRMRQLAVDLVILNDRASSYVQDLQTAIETAVRSAQTRPRSIVHQGATQGAIHTLRADLITAETAGAADRRGARGACWPAGGASASRSTPAAGRPVASTAAPCRCGPLHPPAQRRTPSWSSSTAPAALPRTAANM